MIRKRQSTAKAKFTRVWNVYQIKVTAAENEEDICSIIKDMENAYDELEVKHADYLEALDSEDEGDKPLIKTAQDMMADVYNQLTEGRAAIVSLSKKGKRKPVVFDHNAIPKIRVNKLDAPTFSGELMK